MHALVAFVLLLLMPAQGQHQPEPENNPAHSQPSQRATLSSSAIGQAGVSNHTKVEAEQNQPAPQKSDPTDGWWNVALTSVIAFAACVQMAVMFWQGRIFTRQYDVMSKALIASNQSAEAALRSVAALEKLERPFLMIEVRGGIKSEVWAVNKGKHPAQVVWYEPVAAMIWPLWDEELPQNYNYGRGYYDPNVEVINIEWIAPGGEKQLCYFDTTLPKEFEENIRGDLNAGRRVLYFLSALKYRGMLSDTIFESRWCFRWGGERFGLRLAGPYGYNKYT